MQQREVLIIAGIVIAGFFLLQSHSFTGFQVFRLSSPGYTQPYAMPGGYWPLRETFAFYGDTYDAVSNSCNIGLSDALAVVENALRSGKSIRDLRIDLCVVEKVDNFFFARGYISADIL